MLMDSGRGWEGETAVLQSPWKAVEEESQLIFRVHMKANKTDAIMKLNVFRTSEVGFPEELLKTVRPKGSGWFT